MFRSQAEQSMFAPIKRHIEATLPEFINRNLDEIPGSFVLNSSFKQTNLNQKQLKFVTQDGSMEHQDISYEERIYRHGLIASRSNNWHDYFNALIWLKFPQMKTAINAIHYQEIQKQTSKLRSRKRDLLTLFDECGVIVLAPKIIHQLIKKHQWQDLFIKHKSLWLSGEIKIITFGHAMYEKYLNPYIGMTAKALLLSQSSNDIDTLLATRLRNQEILKSKNEIFPLPVLGIPKWHNTQDKNFYANKNYFR